ncbi:MAG: ECF transporter S component [Erysipelotrichaceae bacterium]|nr:ECF transporter S component [Erysipelotrichaceae bacterium]
MNNIQKLVSAALLMAVGVLLPIVFHSVGGMAVGTLLLPMHLPILIAGALLGWEYGLLCAIITPLVSFMTTGMPMLAKLPYMMAELICYGIIIALLYKKTNKLLLSLLAAQLIGRAVYAFLLFGTALLFNWQNVSAITVWTAFVTGLPGIVLQWVLVPLVISAIKRERCL